MSQKRSNWTGTCVWFFGPQQKLTLNKKGICCQFEQIFLNLQLLQVTWKNGLNSWICNRGKSEYSEFESRPWRSQLLRMPRYRHRYIGIMPLSPPIYRHNAALSPPIYIGIMPRYRHRYIGIMPLLPPMYRHNAALSPPIYRHNAAIATDISA